MFDNINSKERTGMEVRMKEIRRVFFLSILLFALIVGLPTFADKKGETASRTVSLIIAAGPEQAGSDQLVPAARRYREVTINELALIPGAVAPGDRIAITPFLNECYIAVIDRASVDINKTLSLRGRLEGAEGGYLLLSCSMSQVLASISVPDGDRKYQIIYNPALKSHFIWDLDPQMKDAPEDSPCPIPPWPEPKKGEDIPAPLDAKVTIDVMIVYTPAAKTWANSFGGGINNVISQAIQLGQLALDSSATDMTIRLVHSAEIAYTESGDSGTDLERLSKTSDGYMDSVHQWRDTYGADLVHLLADVAYGGIGYQLTNTTGYPEIAFSVSGVRLAGGWGYTVIHEMGHNMGCHHRKDQLERPGPGLYTYSAGWRWIDATGKHCSVMSYKEDGYSRVYHFSNPSITYEGVATGDAVDGDNARGLRNIKGVISNYRQTILGNDDFLGTWDGQGVYCRNSMNGLWWKMASPATLITAGDLGGDGVDDLIGIWPAQGGVWVKSSTNGAWTKLCGTAKDIAAGDMNGDGRDDLLTTWDGDGVYCRNSMNGLWMKIATPADQVTYGDLDADGKADLIGIWPTQGGVWVKYSKTNTWAKLCGTAKDIAAGKMRTGTGGTIAAQALFGPMGGYAQGPETLIQYQDTSSEGPGGLHFVYQTEELLIPQEHESGMMRIPDPGEPGFRCVEEKNLIPEESRESDANKEDRERNTK